MSLVELRRMNNIWDARVVALLKVIDEKLVINKYRILFENSTNAESASFYLLQIFGCYSYMFCEANILLDGHVTTDVQRNGFYRIYFDDKVKGTYSTDSRHAGRGKDFKLQKCCCDNLCVKFEHSKPLKARIWKLGVDLGEAVKDIRSFVHHMFYFASKSSFITGVKMFSAENEDDLGIWFTNAVSGDKFKEPWPTAVKRMTKNDTVCIFDQISEGQCEYAPQSREVDREIIEKYDGARNAARELAAQQEALKVQEAEAEMQKEKTESEAKKLAAKQALTALKAEAKKASKVKTSLNDPSITGSAAVSVLAPTDGLSFVMNNRRPDLAVQKSNKKNAARIVKEALESEKIRLLEVSLGTADAEMDFDIISVRNGITMSSNHEYEAEAEGLNLRLRAEQKKNDRDFISNKSFISQGVPFEPSLSPMFGETLSDKAKSRTIYEQQDVDMACDDDDSIDDSVDDDNDRDSDMEDDSSLLINGVAPRQPDRNVVIEGGSSDDLLRSHLESSAKNITKLVKKARSRNAVKEKGAGPKERKTRDRSIDDDVVEALHRAWTPANNSVDDVASLMDGIGSDEELKKASDKFKDFIIQHVQACAFNELYFERQVVLYLTYMTERMDKNNGEALIVPWPEVLTAIGKFILKEFRESNQRILTHLLLLSSIEEADQNIADMKAFQRTFVSKINGVILSVTFKIIDHWMKLNKKFCDPEYLPVAKKARRLKFMDKVLKVKAGEFSCQSTFQPDKENNDLILAESNVSPDIASLLFLVQPLPKNAEYMSILIEVSKHQAKGYSVDWSSDPEMRALFKKRAIPVPKAKAKVAVVAEATKVTEVAEVVVPSPVAKLHVAVAPSTFDLTGDEDASSSNLLTSSGGSFLARTSSSGFSSSDDVNTVQQDAVRRRLKQLLEFLVAGITEKDDILCMEIKHCAYKSDKSNEGLLLLIDLLEFASSWTEDTSFLDCSRTDAFKMLNISTFVPYKPEDVSNTLGNGYCFSIACLQAKARADTDFDMSVYDMIDYARPLFDSPDSHEELVADFRNLLETVCCSVNNSPPYDGQAAHVIRAASILQAYNQDPFSGVGPELYGALEWVNMLPFNITAFECTTLRKDLKNWAQLWSTSLVPQPPSDIGSSRSLGELHMFFEKPLNSIGFIRPHFFVIASPPRDVVIDAFESVSLSLFMRIKERILCFDHLPILDACRGLLANRVDFSVNGRITDAIDIMFGFLRDDHRVPSSVLFNIMQPPVLSVQSRVQELESYKSHADVLTHQVHSQTTEISRLKEEARLNICQMTKMAAQLKAVRESYKVLKSAEKVRLSLSPQPTSPDCDTTLESITNSSGGSTITGDGSVFLRSLGMESPSNANDRLQSNFGSSPVFDNIHSE